MSAEIVEFDFERPETFALALRGSTKVFPVARPGDNHSDKAAAPFIDEATKSGVRHIVNLTAMGVEQDETLMLRILEKHVEASGIPYTHLRPNWFMQNFNTGTMFADMYATGALHLPADDARLSFIDVRDIAEVAYSTLTQPGHVGKAYTLTGGVAVNHFEVVEMISRVSRQKILYVSITEDVARAGLTRAGVPGGLIDRWIEFYRKIRNGFCAPVSTDVETVLGRKPRSFDQYVLDYADHWK